MSDSQPQQAQPQQQQPAQTQQPQQPRPPVAQQQPQQVQTQQQQHQQNVAQQQHTQQQQVAQQQVVAQQQHQSQPVAQPQQQPVAQQQMHHAQPQQPQQIAPQQIQHQQVQQQMAAQPGQQQAHQPHLMPNLQSQTSVPLSMAMGANLSTVAPGNIRNQITQLPQVHVIQSPSYLPQYTYNQQQLMLQNMQAAVQANAMGINPQLNMANMVAMQGRNTNMFTQGSFAPSPTTPIAPVSVGANVTSQVTTSATSATNTAKPGVGNTIKQEGTVQQQQQQQQQQIQAAQFGQVQQAQATALVGGKPIMLAQATNQILPGGISVLTGQLPSSQTFNTAQFTQLQSKPGQQLGVAGNTSGAQPQVITTQAQIRPQLVASTGQIISSQPVLNSQMLQAMTALQQQYPGQQMISAPGQSPAIITGQVGQSYFFRQANPVQTQGLISGVQATLNPNIRAPTQQTMQVGQVKQNPTLPIQKQTTAAQTGKVLLPSNNKTATAKVLPTSQATGASKGVSAVPVKNKGRPKGVVNTKSTTPTSASVPHSTPPKTGSPAIGSPTKSSETATNENTLSININQSKALSDTEVDSEVKTDAEDGSPTKRGERENILLPQTEEHPPEQETSTEKILPKDVAMEPPLIEKQRAIVKPHILTHVIEGFVIQEGPEPFPVQRSSLLTEFIPPKPGQPVEQSSLISMDENEIENQEHHEDRDLGVGMLRCECCGKTDMASRFGSTGRFCSTSCAKRYNVGCSKRLAYFPGRPKEKVPRAMKRKKHMKGRKGWKNRSQSLGALPQGDADMEDQSSSMSQEESTSPSTTPDHTLHSPTRDLHMDTDHHVGSMRSPSKWNVQEVYEFIKALPGCSPYAEEFKSQEIDGQALLLLKEDHLMTAMNMKLGPALKLCAKINSFKEETG